jgi:hypothetical protein
VPFGLTATPSGPPLTTIGGFFTDSVPVLMTDTVLSSELVTKTSCKTGFTATPTGPPPTESVLTTEWVATLITLTVPSSHGI